MCTQVGVLRSAGRARHRAELEATGGHRGAGLTQDREGAGEYRAGSALCVDQTVYTGWPFTSPHPSTHPCILPSLLPSTHPSCPSTPPSIHSCMILRSLLFLKTAKTLIVKWAVKLREHGLFSLDAS